MLLKKIGKVVFLALNILAATALIISYSSAYIPPDKWWFSSFFGLGFLYIYGINLIFILLWLFLKPRYMIISLVFCLSGLGVINRYIQFRGEIIKKGDLKVISYNVKFFVGTGTKSSKTVADSILRFLAAEDPDLICLQEVRLKNSSVFNLDQIKARHSFVRHYQYASSSTDLGSVTMTRYPIVRMEEIRFKETRNIAIFTDIVVGKDTIRVFNVHLQSYWIDPNKYSIMDSPIISDSEDLREVREVGLKVIRASMLRARQARVISEYIRKSPYSVIVCGDFNDTPVSFTYRKTKGALKDSFVESGKGFAWTYIGRIPSFRIDYIMHSREYRSYNYRQCNLKLSDHVPVTCDLVKR